MILKDVQLQSMHCLLIPTAAGWGYPSRTLIYNFWLYLYSNAQIFVFEKYQVGVFVFERI